VGLNIVYGGSEDSTSDALILSVPAIPNATAYTWSVSGPYSQLYVPPSPSIFANTWNVGDIAPHTGVLVFTVVVQLSTGLQSYHSISVEVGIRTDDVIVVGWINASGVPLPSSVSGVDSGVTQIFPDGGAVGMMASVACNASIVLLSENYDSLLTVNFGAGLLSDADRSYILYWMFFYAANVDPTVALGGDFRDPNIGFTSGAKVANFLFFTTNYKLFNRFQVKYRVFLDGSGFNGTPVILQGAPPSIGSTNNPCGITPQVDGQAGPSNALVATTAPGTISQINDGSPDQIAVAAFNTLTGKDTNPAVFWENIGTKISFSYNYGTNPLLALQPYPDYYVYQNGRMVSERPEASSPILNFNPAPFPSGTVPCEYNPYPDQPADPSLYLITPGGRCGMQSLPPDPSVRLPFPPYVQQ
jgi:hypothetical protein